MGEYTEYGDISPRTAVKAYAKLLKRTNPALITERTAQAKPMQKNTGQTMKFRRYLALAASTSPLVEGVTPSASNPTYVDVSVTLQQYGDWVGITDVIEDTHEDPVLNEFNGILSRQIKDTREVLNLNVLKGGTNVFYSNGSSRAAVNTAVNRGMLKKINRTMLGNNAEYFMEVLDGSPKYGTTPVPSAFYGMAHPDVKADLEAVSGYTPKHKYGDPKSALPNEIGETEEIRWLISTHVTPWADAGGAGSTMLATTDATAHVDVYPLIVVAPDAWGTVPLTGVHSGKVAVVNVKPSKSDPIGQRGSLGWKNWHAALILNDDLMARGEVAVTANPS